MDNTNLQVIRESFGRVAYSHKTHEKDAEIESTKIPRIKWGNIILTTITSGGLLATIITDNKSLTIITAIFSALSLAFTIFQLSFNPSEEAEKHRAIAKELWFIREKYVNLMADLINNKLTDEVISKHRDTLTNELRLVYKFAPNTSSKAYKKAQDALKLNEELTFSDKEIDDFLPENLKLSNITKNK